MELYELSFVKLIKIRDDLVEVIVNDGIEYDEKMLGVYHGWLLKNMAHPCYVMVNKINDYTYTFDVQRAIGGLSEIGAIAQVVYSRGSEIAMESLLEISEKMPEKTRIFYNRDDALAWLDERKRQDMAKS